MMTETTKEGNGGNEERKVKQEEGERKSVEGERE